MSKLFSKNKKNELRQSKTLNSGIRLPNVKEAVTKRWDILKINNKFKDVFAESSLMCFRRISLEKENWSTK